MVVFSNYTTYSLFYSDDAGNSWDKVAGNLEENASGSGNGPSCRTAQIIDFGNSTLYVVGTSVGLFATDVLDGQNTVWEMIGKQEIGNVIIEQIDYRYSDARLTVATYGSGIFQTTINSVDDVLSLDNIERNQLSVYPNPTTEIINVEFTANKSEKVKCIIYNEVGNQVESYFENVKTGSNKLTFDVNTLKTGVYFVSLQLEKETITKQFIKK
jgi:hypothetical protein